MAIFKKPAIKAEGGKKREIPRGLFQKCPGCSETVPEIELAQNQRVCPRCDYGIGSWRENHADDRIRHCPALRGRHRGCFRRRALVRRNVELDADGKNKRRTRATRPGATSVHFSSY